jgi:outer membrane protein TolC
LDEAIAMALEQNRTLQSAALEVARAEHDVATARSRRYPTFTFESQAAQLLTPVDVLFRQGTFGTFPGIGPVPATDTKMTTPRQLSVYVSAQATQPLSQLHELGLAIRLQATGVTLQQEKLRAARLSVVHDVKRQYFAILQTSSELETVEHSITLLREVHREVATRVLQRIVLRSESLDVETRLARAELAQVTLRHALDTQKEQLNQLLGRDVGTPFEASPVETAPGAAQTLDTARTRALESRPDLRQARVHVEQAELALRIARAESVPDLALAFSYVSPLNIDGAPRNIASLGLQFQWEPFDWGRRARTVASSGIAATQARHAAADAEQRAIREVNAEYRRLEQAQAQLRVARLSQETARETARVRTTQFRAHAALLSDVLQSDAAMADANHEYRQALMASWTARAAFDRAVGEEQSRCTGC